MSQDADEKNVLEGSPKKHGIVVHVDQENDGLIPYKNEYFLASHVYHRITNADIFEDFDLHGRNEWSPYVVSRVLPTDPQKEFLDKGIRSSTWTFIVRSVEKRIIDTLKGSISLDPIVSVGEAVGEIVKVEEVELPDLSQEIVKFKSIGPVMIRRKERKNGKEIAEPTDKDFEDLLTKKMLNSYELRTGDANGKSLDVWITGHSMTQVRVSHNEDTLLPAWTLEGVFRGDGEVLKHAYLSGIGAKTALGLGCWEVKD